MQATTRCCVCSDVALTVEVANEAHVTEKFKAFGWSPGSVPGMWKCPKCAGTTAKSADPSGDDRLDGGRRAL